MSTSLAVKTATFTTDATAFAKAVTLVGRASAGSITLAFRDQRVTVTATDYMTTASAKIPVAGKKATTITVDAGLLKRFARAMAHAGRVSLDVTSDEVVMVAGDLEYSLSFMENPVYVIPDRNDPIEVDSTGFARAARLAATAASIDPTRAVLTSVLFDAGRAVATDSYRLMVVDDVVDFGRPVLLPSDGVQIVAAMFDGDDLNVDFATNDTVHFFNATTSVVVRQTIGEFPSWQALIPTGYGSSFTVDRRQLAARLGKLELAGGASARFVVVDDELVVTMRDVAGSKSGIPVETDREVPTVSLNPKLLRQVLAEADADTVTVTVFDELKPVLIHPSAPGWTLLQMPVRCPN